MAAVVHRLDWFPLHQSELSSGLALSLNVVLFETVERLHVKSPAANDWSSNTQFEVNPPVPAAVMRSHVRWVPLEGAAMRFSWIFPAPVSEALPPTERKSAVVLSKSNRKALAFKLSDPEIVEFRVVPSARLSVAAAVDAFKLATEVERELAPSKRSVPALIEIVPLFVFAPARMVVPAPACRSVPFPEMPLAKSTPWVSVFER